jgi:phosphoribosylaminoimidazolecarboxamide formyltransferase / IMP cyclohydrolase
VRALLSVYDKSGLVEFARQLTDIGFELVSTGGTARTLTGAGLQVTAVEDVTGFPEILDGRVKTLHPMIHGALLARTELPEHMSTLANHGITPIDVLVSNLYPFESAASDSSLSDQDKVEQIDIGGPAMVRAAAKNFGSVVVVTDPADYAHVAESLAAGSIDESTRRQLAAKAFGHVSTYDSLVAAFLRNDDPLFPEELSVGLRKQSSLRYGENPQQDASSYSLLSAGKPSLGLLQAKQLHGKELSFNNLLDADAAWHASLISVDPTVSIIKHTVPCGLASRSALADAFEAALAGDPVSAFGGIVSLNRAVGEDVAKKLSEIFFEVIIAPEYTADALKILKKKKNLRILQLSVPESGSLSRHHLDFRPIAGGMLVQTADNQVDDPSTWTAATSVAPDPEQWKDLEFAWKAARLVKSNAIVFAKQESIVGVGAGQPNRLESVHIAARKAGDKAKGAAMASDAFFPFADGVEQAIAAGITAIIQPGGSVRDSEVIDAANNAGVAMVFTSTRHFRH